MPVIERKKQIQESRILPVRRHSIATSSDLGPKLNLIARPYPEATGVDGLKETGKCAGRLF